jgi:hypothetical protein
MSFDERGVHNMSNPLIKYCSEANDLKDVKDAINKIQKLRAQMENPTRDGMIEALRDAKISALIEISALEMAQGATNWVPFSEASDSTLYTLLGQYERGLRLHCIAKIGEKAFDEEMKKGQEK